MDKKITALREYIENRCDGPLTPFVLISRSMQTHLQCKYDASTLANALYESLREFGWIVADEDNLVETGS